MCSQTRHGHGHDDDHEHDPHHDLRDAYAPDRPDGHDHHDERAAARPVRPDGRRHRVRSVVVGHDDDAELVRSVGRARRVRHVQQSDGYDDRNDDDDHERSVEHDDDHDDDVERPVRHGEPGRRGDRHGHGAAHRVHAAGESVGRSRPVRGAHPRRGVRGLARGPGGAPSGSRSLRVLLRAPAVASRAERRRPAARRSPAAATSAGGGSTVVERRLARPHRRSARPRSQPTSGSSHRQARFRRRSRRR